jgi:hypothetical protein
MTGAKKRKKNLLKKKKTKKNKKKIHQRAIFIMIMATGQLSFQGPTFDSRATSRLCRVNVRHKI